MILNFPTFASNALAHNVVISFMLGKNWYFDTVTASADGFISVDACSRIATPGPNAAAPVGMAVQPLSKVIATIAAVMICFVLFILFPFLLLFLAG